jgi:hypothetical protein
MIPSDIVLLGLAGIAGISAIILIIFAVRISRGDEPEQGAADEAASPLPEKGGEPAAEGESPAEETATSVDREIQPSPSAPSTSPEPRTRWEPTPVAEASSNTVATILRNPETGQVILQVEGKPFISAQALKDSSVWPEVESALSELIRWLAEASEPQEIGGGAGPGKAPKPKSMIDEINEILRGMGQEASGKLRGVRLVEGTAGSVRVYVGIENYVLEDVPDPEVRRLIRQAVQEWEARQ